MNAFYEYDAATGLFTGRLVRSSNPSPEFVAVNTREGFGLIDGVLDHLSQRIDPKTGELVDYIPASPGDDYDWSAKSRRWELKPEVAELHQKAATAQTQIDALELSSLRALREIRIAELNDQPQPEASAARLKEIEAQIEALRPDVAAARVSGG